MRDMNADFSEAMSGSFWPIATEGRTHPTWSVDRVTRPAEMRPGPAAWKAFAKKSLFNCDIIVSYFNHFQTNICGKYMKRLNLIDMDEIALLLFICKDGFVI